MKHGGYQTIQVGGKCLFRGKIHDVVAEEANWWKLIYEGGDHDKAFSVRKSDPKLKPLKLTAQEKFTNQVSLIYQTPTSYWLAGWIAAHDESILHVSSPRKDFDTTIEMLDAHKVDYTVGQTLTEAGEATQGRAFTVRTATPDKALTDRYSTETGVNSTIYFDLNTGMVSIQAKEFVLGFLLDELRFKLGKTQDLTLIRSRVPAERLADFEAGFTGAAL